ncbi:MAG: hypothetical protein QM831_14485 [Kofleriaceae bacterium]
MASSHVDQQFDQASLTCTQTRYFPDCLDSALCMCDPTETQIVEQCTGACFDNDESHCVSDSTCFATRDAATRAFIACYPNSAETGGALPACADRKSAYSCEEFSETSPACQPLYTGGQFFSCVDP